MKQAMGRYATPATKDGRTPPPPPAPRPTTGKNNTGTGTETKTETRENHVETMATTDTTTSYRSDTHDLMKTHIKNPTVRIPTEGPSRSPKHAEVEDQSDDMEIQGQSMSDLPTLEGGLASVLYQTGVFLATRAWADIHTTELRGVITNRMKRNYGWSLGVQDFARVLSYMEEASEVMVALDGTVTPCKPDA